MKAVLVRCLMVGAALVVSFSAQAQAPDADLPASLVIPANDHSMDQLQELRDQEFERKQGGQVEQQAESLPEKQPAVAKQEKAAEKRKAHKEKARAKHKKAKAKVKARRHKAQ